MNSASFSAKKEKILMGKKIDFYMFLIIAWLLIKTKVRVIKLKI